MTLDRRFPSGQWTGYFKFSGFNERNKLNLHLNFAERRVTATGTDGVSRFVVVGSYIRANREVVGTIRYGRKLTVCFCGYGECVEQGIWGTWQMQSLHGGFRIWPVEAQSPGVKRNDRLPER